MPSSTPTPNSGLPKVELSDSTVAFVLDALRTEFKPEAEKTPAATAVWGVRHNTIDEKTRVSIPSAWRSALADDKVYLIRKEDGCFWIIGSNRFEAALNKIEKERPRMLDVLSLSSHGPIDIDQQGRVTLGRPFLKLCGMDTSDIVMVGLRRSAAVWRPGAFVKYCEKQAQKKSTS